MAESSKGYARPTADTTNWRHSTRERREVKFCDRLKQIYLDEIRKHGKRTLAALKAGVGTSTVKEHMKQDPEFCEAFDTAYDEYRESRVRKLETQAMRGFEETIFSPTGEKSTRRRYETQLRTMVLRAMDPEHYQERSTVDVNVRCGPMLVPATLSPEEWERQFTEQQQSYALQASIDTDGSDLSPVPAEKRKDTFE